MLLTGCGFSSGLYQDILLAQKYLDERKFQKAVDIYKTILLKKPSLNIKIKVNDQLGEIYSLYLNNYELGIEHFYRIVNYSNEPSWQVRSLEKIGNIYFENIRDYKKASELYLKLIKFVPILENQSFYKFRYALSFLKDNKFEKSISELENLIAEPESSSTLQSYYYLGLAYYYKRDWINANRSWFEYLKRETRKDRIVSTKFLIANAYESSEKLKEAYNIYYSILGEYPNPEVIQERLNSLYKRRVARKR